MLIPNFKFLFFSLDSFSFSKSVTNRSKASYIQCSNIESVISMPYDLIRKSLNIRRFGYNLFLIKLNKIITEDISCFFYMMEQILFVFCLLFDSFSLLAPNNSFSFRMISSNESLFFLSLLLHSFWTISFENRCNWIKLSNYRSYLFLSLSIRIINFP